MDEQTFKDRTRALGLRVIRVVKSLPRERTADVIAYQLLRAGTSVGANYRAACRGRSPADVLSKLAIVEEEADEAIYWLEMLIDAQLMPARRLHSLIKESNEILAMTVASIKTLRSRTRLRAQSKIQNPKSKIFS
jgi:four helix bundle protein